MSWKLNWHVLFVAAVLSTSAVAHGQKQAKAGADDEKLIIKVYRVLDLVTPAVNYPYEGTYLPGGARPTTLSGGAGGGGMGSGMGGGMGGMGGGMGGGMFRVGDNLAQVSGSQAEGRSANRLTAGAVSGPAPEIQPTSSRRQDPLRISMSQLIGAITNVVAPSTWEEAGGEGRIEPIGGALAVRQTAAVQSEVQEFLETLRGESGALRGMTVKARWLALDDAQLAGLKSKVQADKISGAEPVAREALQALPAAARRFAGQISCFNGQMVHIVSGRMESVVQSFIPVVGGNEVGYQPVILMPHVGVLLQVTPAALPGDKAVFLDLHSSVTRWDAAPGPDASKKTSIPKSSQTAAFPAPLDHMKLSAQQFATSARVLLDQPVLIGGMTFPAGEDDNRESQLYLILEVSAD